VVFLITRNSYRKANVYYSDEELAKLIPAEGLTPLQVAELVSISADNRHWMLVFASGATDRILREHACWCARQALALVENPDPRSIQAIEVSERFARGEATLEELNVAWNAANAAADAYAADDNTAWAAYYATTYNTTADNAARSASWYAYYANVTDTARNIIREAQVKDLAKRLTESNFSKKIETKQVISRWKNLGV
jgi:hypothetical protein